MYSILLKVTGSSAAKWKFLTNSEGEIYKENDLSNVQTKVVELLDNYLLSDIKVIKNCVITSSITIEEVEE
jgi:hypothetical protein